jgi:hypothetical protein
VVLLLAAAGLTRRRFLVRTVPYFLPPRRDFA